LFSGAVAILRLIVGALKAQSSSYAAQRAAAGTLIRNRLSELKSCASQAIASVKQAEDAQRLQQQTARDLELADAREQAKEETERVKLVKQAFEKLKREAQRVSKRRQRLIRVLRSILNMLKGDNTASKGSFSKAIKKALEASAFSPYTVGRWSTCSAGCGVGTQTRSVECAGSSCVQPAPASSRPCFTRACPSSCRVGPWLAWTECSKSCGRGVQVRRREVISLGASAKCPTLTQSRTCVDQPCSA
jgi:phage anti-repressor protein